MKVFQMNDCEWWVGESVEACEAAALREYGEPITNDLDGEPHQLSDTAMQKLKFVDEDGTKRTFAEQLQRELDEGGVFPRIFASTEY